MKNYLIGISGGSGAGKTTIVKSLVDHYQNKAAVLELDSYYKDCLLYTSPSPRDRTRSRMPSSA